MIEIRIHGRGGQGNVVAAYLLAIAAFEEGRYAQAFPNFGAERRGAPVTAFIRIADRPIRRRCQVSQPMFLIIQDEALLHVPGVLGGLHAEGGILVNSLQVSDDLTSQVGRDVVSLPASRLAREMLGRPVPNTALLAAFLSLTHLLPQQALVKALADRFSGEVLERNTRLVNEAGALVPAGLWELQESAARA
jgi:pyruvate ferredoxin oxidoreductase gamma subunit